MQGTAGLWCAIAILAVAAAYGLISYYGQTTALEQMQHTLRSADPKELYTRYENQEVGKMILAKKNLEDEVQKMKTVEVPDLKNKLLSKETDLSSEKDRSANSELKYEEQKKINASTQKELEDLRNIIKTGSSTNEQEQRDKEELRKKIDDLSAQLDQAVRTIKSLQTSEKALTESAQNRIQTLQRDKTQLLEAINKKTEAIRRRSSNTRDEADGKILSLDLGTSFCVIDLGRINGVHRGMRFDVKRWRMNKMVTLATIEVTKVGASTSEAVILNEPTVKKICPVTGYVAHDPEERYSPYASGDGDRAIPLISVTQEDVSSMKESDPVVVGDVIVNPVFEKDKQLKIAFAGEPVVYPFDVLKNQIKEAGAILQDKVDIDTDFLVIGKVDEQKLLANENGAEGDKDPAVETYRKTLDIASQYGIPILREVELYDYLRN